MHIGISVLKYREIEIMIMENMKREINCGNYTCASKHVNI